MVFTSSRRPWAGRQSARWTLDRAPLGPARRGERPSATHRGIGPRQRIGAPPCRRAISGDHRV